MILDISEAQARGLVHVLRWACMRAASDALLNIAEGLEARARESTRLSQMADVGANIIIDAMPEDE